MEIDVWTFENDINESNAYYLEKDIAIIHKKPTPIGVVKQVANKITEAYFKSPSTTDYNGLYAGKYIDFEAKETKNKTSFPLDNIHPHQIEHMRKIVKHKGICFLIIRFVSQMETYLLKAQDFLDFIDNNERKSVPPFLYKGKRISVKRKISTENWLYRSDKNGGTKWKKLNF